MVRSFWQTDFDRYGNADLTPPQHKLSKLLTDGTVARMLSQSETSFEFRDVMDTGKILLVDLSDVRSEVRKVLGCFVLSLLHLAAVARSSARPETRKPFHIFCDEAHRFMTDAIEDLIAETRKFNVSLTLAHHYMSQFDRRENDAVSSVGSTVIFSVNSRDADYLKKDLQSRVRIKDLNRLPRFEAIARLGTEIVRIKTLPPPAIPAQNHSEEIIARSRARYCRPSADVDRDIRRRVQRRYDLVSAAGCVESEAQASSGSPVTAAAEHEPTYDEL